MGGQEAEAVHINIFRMCGAPKEGIEVVIKRRISGNYWRKFVGIREGTGADTGSKEPLEMDQN